jgi:hypothetical protein
MKITKNELKSLINECINEIVNEQSHKCNCGSGLDSKWKLDARGIPLAKVCPKCEKDKLKGFRRDVLLDPNYKTNEPIEPDEMEEKKCNCAEVCKCKQSENTQKASETKELINKFKIQRGLKKFPYADDDVVKKYINSHPNSATLKQLEDDAKENKWNEDTTKAIYYIMSIINKKKDNDT